MRIHRFLVFLAGISCVRAVLFINDKGRLQVEHEDGFRFISMANTMLSRLQLTFK